jgi:hypothetical protein
LYGGVGSGVSRVVKYARVRHYHKPGDVHGLIFSSCHRTPFDYTQWHRTLWPEKGVDEVSQPAMKARG